MEAVECGAAALAMVLGYYGRIVPLEQLRIDCGVSRDGTKATNVLKAARAYGLNAKGFKKEPADLRSMKLPLIVFWNFNHFVVVEGFAEDRVYLNDPAAGPTQVTLEEFDDSFTGVVLAFEPRPDFQKGGTKPSLARALVARLRGSELAVGFLALATLGLVIPGLVVPAFTKVFVDEILLEGNRDWFKPLVLGMLFAAAIQATLTWLQQKCLARLQVKLALATTSKFFWHLLHLPMSFFAQRHAGELGPRVMANDRVATLLSEQIATKSLRVLVIAFFAAVMFSYDLVLTLVGIAVAALNAVVLRLVAQKRRDSNRRMLKDAEKVMGTAMAGIQQIETIKASGSESDFFSRWAGYHAKLLNSEQRLGGFSLILTSAPVLLGGLNEVAVLLVGGLRVIDGHLTIGMLVAFQLLMRNFLAPVTDLVQVASTVQEVEGEMHRLDDVLKFQTSSESGPPEAQADTPPRLLGKIELRDISFGYNRCAEPLIKGFSLTMPPGSRVALVGGSGSGKSTISRIVTGLYRRWSGELLLDDRPRDTLPPGVIANSLALVDQDIVLFAGTIRDNLTLWDSTISDASIIQAAKDACIHDAIMARPQGYDSVVEEGGANFSGGQRQRLEIARGLAGNPSILVLDEATSALDPATEQMIDQNLRRRGCTCLIVAHRLSTIRDADEIIVMERGVAVQRGTHDQLIASEGLYARLIREATTSETKPAEETAPALAK